MLDEEARSNSRSVTMVQRLQDESNSILFLWAVRVFVNHVVEPHLVKNDFQGFAHASEQLITSLVGREKGGSGFLTKKCRSLASYGESAIS